MTKLTIPVSTPLDTATTGTGQIVTCAGAVVELVVVIKGTGTISSGALTLEEAHTAPKGSYGGTWSNILGTQTATTIDLTAVSGGKQLVYHIKGCFWDVRPRISTNVGGGGSITVVMFGA